MSAHILKGTVHDPDGRFGVVEGTVTYPEPPTPNTTLLPTKKRLVIWDAHPYAQERGVAGTYSSVTGIDALMQEVGGLNSPVNADRRYWSLGEFLGNNDELATRAHLRTGFSAVCLWTTQGTREQKYGRAELLTILQGGRNEQLRAAVRRALPNTMFAPLHEADGYGSDPALYRAAIHHIIRVMVEEAQRIGKTPNEFAVGGLLTESGMNDPAWRWYEGLAPDLFASNMVGVWFDLYLHMNSATSRPSLRSRVTRALANVPAGLTRRAVWETALALDMDSQRGTIVGRQSDQVANLDEMAALLREGVLEFGMYFSKPDGAESKYGALRGSALVKAAALCKEFTRA